MVNFKEINLGQEIIRLKNLPGKERGIDYNNYLENIKLKVGEQGMKKLENELKKFGFEMYGLKHFDDYDWIQEGLPYILLVGATKVFQWSEKDLYDLGASCVATSPVLRVYIRYFSSIEGTIKKAVKSWEKHSTTSLMELSKFDKKAKEIVLRLKNFDKHPAVCLFYMGAFAKVVKLATGNENVIIKETKCNHRGDSYHEFVINY